MISPSTIERIRNAANIVDVVSKYVTLRRAGSSYRGLCPFHDDTTPSFYVSPSRGICKCFACGEGGDVVHFIMKEENLGYYDALKFLAKMYGIEVEDRELSPEERLAINERESMFAVNEWASTYFHDILLHSEEGQTIGLAYFRSRGFRDDIIEKFRLGFSPSTYDAMVTAALKEGYKEEYLLKTGLTVRRENGTLYDKYHGRVIFPWFTITGKIVGFGGRVLDSRTKGVSQKYINSPESEIYHKASQLYGLYQAKKAISREDNVFMVEGYTDVISMHQCGIENVVANSGTALSMDQISILHRFTDNITLLYDGDAAGQKAALRGTDMLLSRGMRIKILLLPDNDDPDSFARKHSSGEFREYVRSHQVDFITFKTNLLLAGAKGDPDKMSDLIRSLVESIAVVPEEIERSVYVHRCSEILQIDERVLLRAIQRQRKHNWEQKQTEKEREEQHKHTQVTGEASVTNDATNSDAALSDGTATSVSPFTEPESEVNQTDTGRKFKKMEQVIMQAIVGHGEQMLEFKGANGETEPSTIIGYISNALTSAELQFRTPIYARMFEAVVNADRTDNFVASEYFLNSPEEEISQEAAKLLSDRFQFSREAKEADNKIQPDEIVRMVVEYKTVVVSAEINDIMKQMSDPEIKQDPVKTTRLLQEQMRLTKIKKQLAKELGQRVISR